ncbi:hypothetical protein QO002_005742 [Pararhizobium capsulatum DSM 1112]|uniref:Uncharacterized protein n=1 Tax=Pararhizobium capsulatum DSM 1112 TaxID=1121113 RepID=A0ABU0BZ37_9HYPH|nr:hypothetical protein [Pararhizobium capsulatum DSM 1112]
MDAEFFAGHDQPLSPADLEICQSAFDALCEAQGIEKTSAMAHDAAAASIIRLYRGGVRNVAALQTLATGQS